ncbi:MAG: HipA N-terminal domain-containing protein [Rhodothermia bacterium]
MSGKMIKKFKRVLNDMLGNESLHTPKDAVAEFQLSYNNLNVGTLTVRDGLWVFSYSADFKKQQVVSPLVDFRDVGKIYEAEDLWPFFSIRIPSKEQAAVKEAIKNGRVDANNEVGLLKLFGEKTIANPFRLTAVL